MNTKSEPFKAACRALRLFSVTSIFSLPLMIVVFHSQSIYAQSDIRSVDFNNFTYSPYCAGEDTEKITVSNGEFSKETQMDGYIDRLYFKVFQISYGDINADGRPEAVILTVCNTGGTGQFTEGFVYGIKNNKPVLITRIAGGDRAYGGLVSAKISNGRLIVESNDPGENGASCCPEFILTTTYQLRAGKLEPIGKPLRRAVITRINVRFRPGASSTSLKIPIDVGLRVQLVFRANRGQRLEITAIPARQLNLWMDDSEFINQGNKFITTLKNSGEQIVNLESLSRRNQIFNITVTIR